MSSARSVAKELVRCSLSEQVPDPLTYSRLQALLYYAQGWSLVLRNSEFFPEEIVYTPDGPAVLEREAAAAKTGLAARPRSVEADGWLTVRPWRMGTAVG